MVWFLSQSKTLIQFVNRVLPASNIGIPFLLHPLVPLSHLTLSTPISMDLSLCAPILGTDIGFCSLMTRLTFAHSTLCAPRMRCLECSRSTRLGLRHSLASRSSVCVMTRVGSIFPKSLKLLQTYMVLNFNTLFKPLHSKMVLLNKPIA